MDRQLTAACCDPARVTLPLGVALQIADGYHRVCASYHLDENTVPCRIVAQPGVSSNASTIINEATGG